MSQHEPKNTVILLAEGKEKIRQLVSSMLIRHGYELLIAENGEEALNISKNYSKVIHMLLTNIVMPGIDGFSLATAIRLTRPEIRAIVMSSHMDSQIIDGNQNVNAEIILDDEFFPITLLETVQSVMNHAPTATSAV